MQTTNLQKEHVLIICTRVTVMKFRVLTTLRNNLYTEELRSRVHVMFIGKRTIRSKMNEF